MVILLVSLYVLANSDIPSRLAQIFNFTKPESRATSEQNYAAMGAAVVACLTYLYLRVIPLADHKQTVPNKMWYDALLAVDTIYLMFMVYMLMLPSEQAQ